MKTLTPFPALQDSLRPGGTNAAAVLKNQNAFKRELVARMIAESARELSQLATLVHLSEMVRMRTGE